MTEFVWRTRIQRSAEDVFCWHERPGAFQRLAPPWVKISVESADQGIRDGAEVRLSGKIGPFTGRWHLRHENFVAGRSFSDRQVAGPFRQWLHHHRFEPAGENACDLVDRVEYELPGGAAGASVAGGRVRRELERLFRYRHDVTRMDLETHPLPASDRPLVVAVTGATGLVGSVLTALLQTSGHEVRVISRGGQADIPWDPEAGKLEARHLLGVDAFIHLAGEPIAQRWTEAARRRILESRRRGTRLLAEAAAALPDRPRAFVSVSGANAYGFARPETVTEESGCGAGFLADVCREWEEATRPAAEAGIRTVIVRSGMVLSPAGGALAKLLPLFRAGLGGPVGRGQRWMSWIAIDDLASILAHAVLDPRYDGVINGVAPQPVKNAEFTRLLGQSLHRPAVAPVPPAMLRLTFGRMAEETILGDLQVEPRRLAQLEYLFRYPELSGALGHLLGAR